MTEPKLEDAVLKKMANGQGGDRPLKLLSAEQVLRLGSLPDGKRHRQLDTLVQAWAELVDARNSRRTIKRVLEGQFAQFGLRAEPWLGAALKSAQTVRRTTRGRHHVYVLACDGFGEDGKGLGLYVGETSQLPEKRFAEHASGLGEMDAARQFRLDRKGTKRRPLSLLPSFYAHLNPLTKSEAKKLEVLLVEALVAGGVPSHRVGGPRDLKCDEMELEASPFGDSSQVSG